MNLESFKHLVSSSKQNVFRLALWYTHNREDAEDIVQDVYMKFWQLGEKTNHIKNKESYIKSMVRNRFLSLNSNNLGHKVTLDPDQYFASPLLRSDNKDDLRFVNHLIELLPEKQRTVLRLRGVEGMDVKDISEFIGETENNVRVLLSRARKELKKNYETYSIRDEK